MYTDIHSHIISGIDDGAKDMDTAVRMLRMAAADGTAHIVATPPFIFENMQTSPEVIVQKTDELQKLALREGINLAIHPGCEVFLCPEVPELYEKGLIRTVGDSSYILIELPAMSVPAYTDQVLYELQLKGLIPVIAHPERNMEITGRPEILADMVRRGMLTQVNSGSINGIFGKETKKAALRFIGAGWVQFVASDAHTTGAFSEAQ